ncbi:MAG TPA: hypothetical protein VN917_05140 [Xanthobacteraceae bacterium]|nr:hypothetical protein [Xanthobacteraceae bacterium]
MAAFQVRTTPRQKVRGSRPGANKATRRRQAEPRETTDFVVVMIRRRPLPALALALGMGLVLGVAWRR